MRRLREMNGVTSCSVSVNFVHLGRQGPVGSQHSEPDTHGDQNQKGGRREREEREEELALRWRRPHHSRGFTIPRNYLEEKIGAEKREGDDSGAAQEDDLEHRKQEPG